MASSSNPALDANLSFVDGGPGGPVPNNIWEWLQPGINVNPSATAIISLHQPEDHLYHLLRTKKSLGGKSDYLSWSYEQLEEASLALATHLSAQGIGDKDVIATVIPNSVEWAILFWAAIRLGATFVPLDPNILKDEENLVYLLRLSRTTVVVVDGADRADRFDTIIEALEEKPEIKVRLVCSSIQPQSKLQSPRSPTWQHLADIKPPSPEFTLPSYDQDPSKAAVMMFTSGTTGRPKGVVVTHSSLCVQTDGFRNYAATPTGRWNPSMRFLLTVHSNKPLYWTAHTTTWRSGGALILAGPEFEPRSVLRALADPDLRASHISLVPRTLRILAHHPDLLSGTHVPAALQFAHISGDVVDRALIEQCRSALRAKTVIGLWGMTEGAGAVGWARQGDSPVPFAGPERSELVGVGRALPGVKLKICAPGSRVPVPRGEMGDLHVCGAQFINAYLEGREERAFYTDEAGERWFVVQDKAFLDGDGILYILGREKDIIVTEQTTLPPAVIEASLNRQQEIDDAQVVGVARDGAAQVPVAVVKTAGDGEVAVPELDQVNGAVEKELGSEYKLAGISGLKEVGLEDWPYNTMGKVMKKDIAAAVGEHA